MNKEPQKRYIEMVLSQAQVPARNLAAAAEAASGLLSRAYFNEDCRMMEVLATAYVKKDIAAKAGLKSASSVNSGINALAAAGVIEAVEAGVYRFRQEYFGKRDWHGVKEARAVRVFGDTCSDAVELVYHDGVETLPKAAEAAGDGEEVSTTQDTGEDGIAPAMPAPEG